MKTRYPWIAFTAVFIIAFFLGALLQRNNVIHYTQAAIARFFTGDQRGPGKAESANQYRSIDLTCDPALAAKKELKVIAIGDTRGPTWKEKFLVFEAIMAEKPDVLIHLGDITYGANDVLWDFVLGEEVKLFEEAGIVLPVIGNHEYSVRGLPVSEEKPIGKYFDVFPHLEGSEWYRYTCGPFDFLSMNFYAFGIEAGPQREWLYDAVQNRDSKFLVIGMHEPLHTAHMDYALADTNMAPLKELFESEPGADIVLAGHIHNYEHYFYNDTHYIVSGGGGSPPHVFDRDPDDLFQKPGEHYHYVRMMVTEDRIAGTMVRYDQNLDQFVEDDPFIVRAD